MSMLLGPQTFEEKLELAFGGDAGEQRKARKRIGLKVRAKLSKTLGFPSGPAGFLLGRREEKPGGPNIFNKSNLGGTNRLTR